MATFHVNARTALRKRVAQIWPDCATGGIYTSTMRFARVMFEDKTSVLPVAVLEFNLLPDTEGQWGGDAIVDKGEVTIYRIAADSEDEEELLENLERLRVSLMDSDPVYINTTVQCIDQAQVSDSMQLPINQFLLTTQRPFVAGAVIVRVVVGDDGD